MLKPLCQDDTLGISAPAGPVKRELLEAAVERLQRLGFRVKLSPSVMGKRGFLSATDDVRASELSELFTDPDVAAVIAARGGVGTSRLLGHVATNVIAESGKPFLGFSDLTALQWLLWARHRTVSFSGPLAVEFSGSVSTETETLALDMLFDQARENWLAAFPDCEIEILRGGAREVIAPLLPGNLTVITTLLGTPYLPDLRGSILAIEDISEPPYRVDRLLFHLRNAGALQNLAALLIGDFGWPPDDTESRERLRESVLEATAGTAFPILLGLPYGHGSIRLTLPVGAPVRLTIRDGAVQLGFALSPFETSL